MKKTSVLVLLLLTATVTIPAQKIYWGDSVPKGWNGKWPAKLLTVPEKTNFERTAMTLHVLEFIAEKLRTHNVNVDVLTKSIKVSGEEFVIDKIGKGNGDGYSMIELDGGFATSPVKEFPAGTFRVDMAQPMANVAFYMLEPQAADGFVGSGVFDAVFTSLGADTRSIVYPVYTYFKILD